MTDEQELWDLVASRREGVLATIARDGTPQLSNVLYVVGPASRMVRISTTDDRAKARNLARDPRASMHVAGDNFWQYAVMTGAVSLSAVAATPGDAATDELLLVHSGFYGSLKRPGFDEEMVARRRLVVRLHAERLHGLIRPGRRPVARS